MSKQVAQLLPETATAPAMQRVMNGYVKSRKDRKRLPAEDIELLFKTFARRWPTKWKRNFEDKNARKLWQIDLATLGVDDTGMRRGLERCVVLDWPPSPSEFAAFAKVTPEELGLPDEERAYKSAAAGKWRIHPAVYEAARKVGTWDLKQKPEAVTRPRFMMAYADVVHRVQMGEVFTLPEDDNGVMRIERSTMTREQIEKIKIQEMEKIEAKLRGCGDEDAA